MARKTSLRKHKHEDCFEFLLPETVLHLLNPLSTRIKFKTTKLLFVLVDDQSPIDSKTYDPQLILETHNIKIVGARPRQGDERTNVGNT